MIVDDEPLAIRALTRLLAAHPEVELVGAAGSLTEGRAAIEAARPDAVFLDVDLGEGDGFELMKTLGAPSRPAPCVVFVTAHSRHAVDAFAIEAADYLLKPVTPERLADALRRLRRRLADAAKGGAGDAPPPEMLELRMPSRTLLVEPARLAALTAEGDFTRVHLADEPSLLILRTLSQFEAQLPDPPFHRLGRSVMVNLDRVRRIVARDRNLAHVTLEGGEAPLALGRTASARLRAALAARRAE
ncbi:two component transcriptional regulator, LytTR family [Albimonas donghaensis]|uniref:Two component transcriptional regulator, LytTR family n=1 Tax=Albimonas donghaensis TaxID=356660 RepID=A0A1H3CI88_9RHOB|nr:LytTR family DNA-binding domain-containing protein [Albimonas donghaensis]SDX53825.1 two component transcriptional regulator, LytTR family [Albimonas donghaensis]